MDIDQVQPAFAKREFLAVLIAGFGNELLPLTSDNGDEPSPKPLLPVANKPLLEYVLSWLEQSGIKDVLLICPAIHQPALYHHINSDISSSALRVDLQTYDETQEDTAGTCALLRHFASRITEDFVVVPCDFITPPSLPLSTLLNKFRTETTSNGAIISTCWYPAYIPEKGILLDEWGPVPSPPAIIWDASTESLLYIDTPDDRDKNAEEMEIKMDLLTHDKLNEDDDAPNLSFKVTITIHQPSNGLALRINNLYAFLETNRSFLSTAAYSLPTDPKNRSLIDQKAQISTDTIVGDSTQISERTIIKRSVIGRHCIIGKNVKISGCILFDHCVVEDGAKLDGCILGKNTKVGSKSELTRCISCGGFEVNAGDTLKGEKLDISDWAAGTIHSTSNDEDQSSDDLSD
ncbi:hypothetical protein EST38_g8768 [Candolleomyces aberdarensis]|uniref:Translation initiation factor eIF2B subunit gamma n=1 Tax=Candolleomyces aberdarensis TaxID=2316362 RepID=A0A4Q2DDZ4_9AGAR|nr:hypothetical protein EST38_g8768 [Candolleomyces aberdarensis]